MDLDVTRRLFGTSQGDSSISRASENMDDGVKAPPHILSGGKVTNIRKNQFVGEYHLS